MSARESRSRRRGRRANRTAQPEPEEPMLRAGWRPRCLPAGVCGFPAGSTAIRYSFSAAANLRTESNARFPALFRPSAEMRKVNELMPSLLRRFSIASVEPAASARAYLDAPQAGQLGAIAGRRESSPTSGGSRRGGSASGRRRRPTRERGRGPRRGSRLHRATCSNPSGGAERAENTTRRRSTERDWVRLPASIRAIGGEGGARYPSSQTGYADRGISCRRTRRRRRAARPPPRRSRRTRGPGSRSLAPWRCASGSRRPAGT